MKYNYNKALRVKRYEGETPFSKLAFCGIKKPLYPFQVKGVIYMYHAGRCILADATGLGKTVECVSLFQLLEHLGHNNKWIIVTPSSCIFQWEDEFKKFTTLSPPALGIGSRQERMSSYIAPDFWQFYITSYQMLWRDWEMIKDLGIKNWVFDDSHFFRHHSTKTARIVKFLTRGADRIVLATATPKQKSTMDLHSLLEALGLNHIFGSEIGFENHYCVMRKTKRTLRDGRTFWQKEEVGLRNSHELKRKLEPFLIKRTFAEVGKELPGLIVKPVWLKLYPRQESIYNQTRNKIIRAWDKGEIKQIPNKGFHSLIQSCVGTRVVGFEEDVSVKADAVMQFVNDKLGIEGEKLIVYSFYKEPIRTLISRLKEAGRSDFVLFTGDMNKIEKEQARREFQYDNNVRILLATGAAEMGINLQSARYLIMMNLILNSQRMIQLVGRLRRLGSKHKTVVVYPLLARNTIEERLWSRLKYENALTDMIFDEKSDVFPPLTSMELLSMLRE